MDEKSPLRISKYPLSLLEIQGESARRNKPGCYDKISLMQWNDDAPLFLIFNSLLRW